MGPTTDNFLEDTLKLQKLGIIDFSNIQMIVQLYYIL